MFTKIRRRLSLLRQLPRPVDWLFFAHIFLFALLAPWRMRQPLPVVARKFTPVSMPGAVDEEQVATILLYVELALQIGRPLVQVRCLTRGFTRYYFLQRSGFPVDLHFGVAPLAQHLTAHCWLEHNGAPFAETVDPRQQYTTVYIMSAAKQP